MVHLQTLPEIDQSFREHQPVELHVIVYNIFLPNICGVTVTPSNFNYLLFWKGNL